MSDSTTQAEQAGKTLAEKEGKYLTFVLGSEEFGLEILKVREIIDYTEIAAVPQKPHYVKGVINLRNQIIPVIDLRARFDMETTDVTEQTCIIVCEIQNSESNFIAGMIVDNVEEVIDIDGRNIEQAPQSGTSVNTGFILGIGRTEESARILLDIDKVLLSDDFTGLVSGPDISDSDTVT